MHWTALLLWYISTVLVRDPGTRLLCHCPALLFLHWDTLILVLSAALGHLHCLTLLGHCLYILCVPHCSLLCPAVYLCVILYCCVTRHRGTSSSSSVLGGTQCSGSCTTEKYQYLETSHLETF